MLPFTRMRQGWFGNAKVCHQVKTKRPRLIVMTHSGVCRETFVFICVDRRFSDRQQRAVDRGLIWEGVWRGKGTGKEFEIIQTLVTKLGLKGHLKLQC